ncbi:hypothetical protein MMYC01_206977 [Madurella mycetomatis]|uniref:Uncharacterized protein n=1 Tax=Madurella mycetomatis TaxID=100816 RepID=A0A175W495_9PEZI|nr:hypothetical protein MMYC01_206977 [Madurella mycetomatis]
MPIESDTVMSSESYDKLEPDDKQRSSIKEVQDFLNRGLITQRAVYQRFTEALSEGLATYYPDRPDEASNIRQAFHQLQIPAISKERFESAIREKFPGQVSTDTTGLAALIDILIWHAAFPFPLTCTVSGTPFMDEDAFFRAICLLTRDPTPRYGPSFSSAAHRLHTGTWGSHDGWLVGARGKDGQDFRRYLFRSLAEPMGSQAVADTPTKIPVPRFIMYQYREPDDDEPCQIITVKVDEEERSVDLQDILSEYPPEVDPLTANPLREAYWVALDSLPRQPHDLAELSVPTAKLISLLKLLYDLEDEAPSGEEAVGADLMTLAQELSDEPSHTGWPKFDALLSSQTERIANALSRVFSIFKSPLGPVHM